jgi:hypothetical protein
MKGQPSISHGPAKPALDPLEYEQQRQDEAKA